MSELSKKRTGYCRSAARSLLARYNKDNSGTNLPVPVCKIAQYKGYQVVRLESLPDEHSAIVELSEKLIGVNQRHHPHRRRFSIGHELGHVCLEHPPEDEQSDDEVKLYNLEANEFAGELLVPLEILKRELQHGRDVEQLVEIFNVSTEVIFRRISAQGLLSLM